MKNKFLSQYLVGDFHTEGLEDEWLDYAIGSKSPEYPSPHIQQTLDGLDFSRQTILNELMISGFNLAEDFPVSTVPVYFLHGRFDYQCPGELVKEYYDLLQAPDKSFTWFENSAHDVYYDEPEKFNQEVIRIADEILNRD